MFQCHSITCSYPVFLTPFIKKTLLSPLFCILSFIGQKLVVVVYLLSRVQLLGPHWQWPARLLCPWDSPDNTGVGCHFSPQGIFPTQGSNPGLLHCRQILYSVILYHMTLPLFKYLYPHRLNSLQIRTAVCKTNKIKRNKTLKFSAPSKVRLLSDDFLNIYCFPCPVLVVGN